MIEIKDYKDKHEFVSDKGVKSVVYLMDCMDALKQIPEKYFELAIVDPPYGNFNGTIERTGGTWSKKYQGDKNIKNWDYVPKKEYFESLFCVSINQIIWGGNYFNLRPSRHFLIWEKLTISENFSMAMVEYAWSSINDNAKLFKCAPQAKERFHPTQKPIALYEWLIKNYAKEGDKILDTHLGSGSSRIAAYKANLPFMGCELDPDYFHASVKRFENEVNQLTMF